MSSIIFNIFGRCEKCDLPWKSAPGERHLCLPTKKSENSRHFRCTICGALIDMLVLNKHADDHWARGDI